jgi:hypothetical protein
VGIASGGLVMLLRVLYHVVPWTCTYKGATSPLSGDSDWGRVVIALRCVARGFGGGNIKQSKNSWGNGAPPRLLSPAQPLPYSLQQTTAVQWTVTPSGAMMRAAAEARLCAAGRSPQLRCSRALGMSTGLSRAAGWGGVGGGGGGGGRGRGGK